MANIRAFGGVGGMPGSTLAAMSETASMPSLHTGSSVETQFDSGSAELLKFRYSSVLVQIEITWSFRNDVEPLFQLIRRVLPAQPNRE